MFVCVLGTSTAFSYWAFGVARHAVEEFAGAVHHVHCTSIADMHAQWEKRSGRPVLFTTDVLEEKISTLILESGAPIVVLVDPADVAIATAAKLRPMSFLDSVRHTSLYISSLSDVLANTSTVVFGAKARTALVHAFLPRFLRAMRLPEDAEFVAKVLQRVCPDEALQEVMTVEQAVSNSQPIVEVAAFLAECSEREVDAFRKVSADYQQILDRNPIIQITWPSAILHSASLGYSTEKPLPLIGPARPLIWGPYMHLPKGKWTASMEFESSENHSPNTLVAEVLIDWKPETRGEFDLPVQGIFVWKLQFEVKDSTKPIEVRLTLNRSAIEGTFFLREVRLSSVAELG